MMKFEISKVRDIINKFNPIFFNSIIPSDLKINFFKSKNALARVLMYRATKTATLELNTNATYHNEEEMENTIIHEMVHLYQLYTDCKDLGHGRDFKRLARYIDCTSNGKYQITRISTSNNVEIEKKSATIKNESCFIAYIKRNDNMQYRVYKNVTGSDIDLIKFRLSFIKDVQFLKYYGTLFNGEKSCQNRRMKSISFTLDQSNKIESLLKENENGRI